jgi:hypothetical protein
LNLEPIYSSILSSLQHQVIKKHLNFSTYGYLKRSTAFVL